MLRSLSIITLIFTLFACSNQKTEKQDPVVAIGDTVSTQLMKSLFATLSAEMQSNGPIAALKVCNLEALPLTAELNTDQIKVSRTSLKVRNPKNAPDAIDKAVLSRMAEEPDWNLPQHVTMKEDGGPHRYYKPIRLGKPCLSCHGQEDDIEPALLAEIKKLYPNDQATGYKEGELRGAFKVVIADELIRPQ
jgi:hypothetical protein